MNKNKIAKIGFLRMSDKVFLLIEYSDGKQDKTTPNYTGNKRRHKAASNTKTHNI